MGVLYSVAVPLGNLADITFRAVDILNSVDCIACEDTRKTKILLDKYNISTNVIDCHKFNERERSGRISQILGEDGSVALVSDAGTPGICDPGCVLEKELLEMGHKIVPIPGASALTAFLSAVPRNNEFFAFIGFMPKTAAKKIEIFEKFSAINTVFYDSPNRLIETLKSVKEFFGADKKVAVARELTKIFEEIKIGTAAEILDYYDKNTLKGEIVGMIFASEKKNPDDFELIQDIETLKKQGFSDKDTAKILASIKNVSKNKIYELAIKH